MDPHITPGTVVYKLFVDKLGGNNSEVFVGDEGQIFYDPTIGDLRLSNDVTAGGIPLSQMMATAPAGNTHTYANGTVIPLPGSSNTTVVYEYSQLEAQGVINYGNVKQGFQGADHFGWVLLDGRAVSALTVTQQAIAVKLGWTTNIPDAYGRLPKMTGEVPGTVGGLLNDINTIVQQNLPNVTLNGVTDAAEIRFHREDHAGATFDLDGRWLSDRAPGSRYISSVHTHTVTVDLNPTAQTLFDVENAYMAMNTFAFLGL